MLAEAGINNLQCARRDSNVCIFSQYSTDRLIFNTFDSQTGRRALLKVIPESEWFIENWSLSPERSLLALAKKHRGATMATIRTFGVEGSNEHTLSLNGWFGISFMDWAADGKSLWVNASSAAGTPTLLNVKLSGKVTPSLEETEMQLGWAIPSPDGVTLPSGEASRVRTYGFLKAFDSRGRCFRMVERQRDPDLVARPVAEPGRRRSLAWNVLKDSGWATAS